MDSTVEASTDVNPSLADHDDESAYLLAMQLSRACELPMVLQAAIELGLLEIISKLGNGRPMSALEISASLPGQNPEAPAMIYRLLRLLVTHGILTCSLSEQPVCNLSTERVYGPTPVCKFFTQDEDGLSLAPFCLMMQDKVLMESWYYLKDAILEGGVPFDKVFGMSAFEYYRTNSRFTRILHWGTSSHSAIVMKKIFETYKGFQGLSTLVDVGGGIGATLCMIVSKHPDIKAINLDQRHVIDQAPPHPDIEHVSGDMFVKVPKGDAILLKEICHEWSDVHCLKILQNCHKALPEDGKVIVVECILPEVPDTSPKSKLVVHWDCLMLCYNPCGRERTKDEYEALAKGSGFKGFRIACNACGTYVMEFLKQQQQLCD